MAIDTPTASTSSKRARETSPSSSNKLAGYDPTAFYPQAGPASARKKSRAAEDAEPEEKRAKMYKKAPPKAIQERADRVRSQRFFCVARKRTTETSEEFNVLGSTGNVYTVSIRTLPSCTCPDGAKGNHCKHIIFVLLKILQVPLEVNLWYQAALLQTELRAIFAHARPAPQDRQAERVAKLYRVATGEEEADAEAEAGGSGSGVVQKKLPEEGDDCPICYEEFTVGQKKGLVFCLALQGCGNPLHSICFGQWSKQAHPVTCPLCRAKWETPAATPGNTAAGPSYSSEGYLNLGAAAGISQKRDTSSYYRGPQRGRRWDGGYGRYGEDDWY
ncbi:hypothetical protein BCR35DRAFT_300624 [Leucosporidium creatinivorum]|uniref:SWIM-type domain-containing protein n=1 Tax=Leucosporidium creatinivorum TaxID=106004 RepID=A0A1Y2FZ83_9BASI|nr:hypothetical protein BCR35DRAFT_300624 [Leucosporidium creatinivorum]